MDIIGYILTGGAAAAAIKLLDNIVQWALARRAKAADSEAREETEEEKKINGLQAGLRVVLLDRIQWLGQSYIKAGEITFDDRRRLHMMHEAYHNGLAGNGDLDTIMEAVDELPLK